MYDADDPGTVFNEFLLTVFLPAITVFVTLWAVFRLYWNDVLRSWGLAPIVPRDGAGAVAAGYGRFLLLIACTVAILLAYLAAYRRFLRGPLRGRGLV